MPRNYVDNAYNRSAGRVGMSVGSAVISSSSGGGGGSRSGGGYSYGSSGGGSGSSSSYVDNAYNRSVGRVGLEHGTAVISRSSSGSVGGASSSGSGTYVDNAYNRSVGRVGLEHGSAVISKSSSSAGASKSSDGGPGVYVDNASNRQAGRVGLEIGTAIISKSSSSSHGGLTHGYDHKTSAKTYTDNAYNQRLGRVGMTFGSAVQSSATKSYSNEVSSGSKCYVDNPMNRRLGRVGKPKGSAPVTSFREKCPRNRESKLDVYRPLVRFDPEDDDIAQALEKIVGLQQQRINDLEYNIQCEKAKGILYRHEAAQMKYSPSQRLKVSQQGALQLDDENVIDYDDLALGAKLGGGGFGDVHIALWGDTQVAVKKLRVQRVSQDKKEKFKTEVLVFSTLNHPAILKFYGACIVTPNLAIVMEFMAKGSLYDVLHVEEVKLTRKQKFQMIKDVLSALEYLHGLAITHRDIKSMNILVTETYDHCKLGDFGLALKDYSQSSSSVAEFQAAGTVKYSPPEVLDGERLSFQKLKMVDIYSASVVFVEILTETEPFEGLNVNQIRREVLKGGRPSTSSDLVTYDLKNLLQRGMAQDPAQRPSAALYRRELKLMI